jgi:hypothetical protein
MAADRNEISNRPNVNEALDVNEALAAIDDSQTPDPVLSPILLIAECRRGASSQIPLMLGMTTPG